jgi:hypothetical protein
MSTSSTQRFVCVLTNVRYASTERQPKHDLAGNTLKDIQGNPIICGGTSYNWGKRRSLKPCSPHCTHRLKLNTFVLAAEADCVSQPQKFLRVSNFDQTRLRDG